MKKVGMMLFVLCLLAASCSRDEKVYESVWSKAYPWMGKIMTDAENGKYKDLSGRDARVSIELFTCEGQFYIGLNYGRSGGVMYEDVRSLNGEVAMNLEGQYKRVGMIYPIEEIRPDVLRR
ncbi:hypothetical protein [Tannerella forsythia]|uniref:Uncharacterized protein n=1 Tax=Tannerella forsythia TaxID=28112 RepID=A0A3P1YPB1_TANFO|nr:hypothetical protein [Tannerella forsythia]RRD72545.1 hypothetical protein EII41_10860 [Tannerella forsythia]